MKLNRDEREMVGMGLKYTKLYTKLRNPERTMLDITPELAEEILYSKKRKKDWIRFCRDDGRMIVWFKNELVCNQFRLSLEENKEPWYQTDSKTFNIFGEEIWVAEFESEALIDKQEQDYIDGAVRSYYGIKEDDGRYSVYDVYSPSELGIKVYD